MDFTYHCRATSKNQIFHTETTSPASHILWWALKKRVVVSAYILNISYGFKIVRCNYIKMY